MAKKKTELNIKELRIVFENSNNSKSKIALSLLEKAEFMEETLKKLQEKVNKFGVVTKMCQGSYEIERENPALKSYNTTIKNYSSIMKQLNDMLPAKEDSKNDDFDEFGDDK